MAIRYTHMDFFGHKSFLKSFSYMMIQLTKFRISASMKLIKKSSSILCITKVGLS